MKRLLRKLVSLYDRVGRYGDDPREPAGARKMNELYNKGWFFIFGAVFSNLVATLAIVALMMTTDLIPFDRTVLVRIAKAYVGVEAAACLLMLAVFFSGRRLFLSPAGPIAAVTVVFSYYFTLALFAGKDAGIHYILFQFFPMSLMMNTRSRTVKLVFLLYMVVVTVLAFYLTNIFPPLYPLPGTVIDIIFYMVVFFLVTYTLVALYFTIWHLNYIDVLVGTWKKLTDLGNQHYATEEGVKGNRISNQLFLLAMLVSVVNFIAATAMIIKSVNIDFERNIYYTVLFYPAWVFGFCTLAVSYYLKNRRGRNLPYELVSIAVLAAIFIFYSIVAGSGAGVHYMFSFFVVIPLFINTESGWMKAGLAGLFLAVFLVMMSAHFEGLYPFPGELERRMRSVSLAVVVAMFALASVITWVRFDVTARVLRLWDRLTERGFHLFASESEKRLRKIQSSVMLVFLAATVFCLLVQVGLVVHMWYVLKIDAGYVMSAVVYYGPSTVAMISVLLVALYFQEKTRTILPAICAFIPAVAWHFFMGISLSHGTLFSYFKIVMLPIPFIALDRRLKYQRVLIFTAILMILVSLAAEVAFHFRSAPLFPIPEQYTFPTAVSVILALTISLIVMSYYFYKQTAYAEISLAKEKAKSDMLLLNVLPLEVADELKSRGASRPSRIENVTVLFADFHGFHALAECMTPEELIDELDLCFTKFDKIIERHGLEKLKTMGPAYMCAAGAPRGNRSTARDCVDAAVEMIAFMKEMKRNKAANGERYWDARIGLNTGPVVAGVIGNRKFVYDIWGDTVNVASRMMTTGLPGKINISRSTYNEVRQYYKCRYRGKVLAKNKGRLDQYHVQVRA